MSKDSELEFFPLPKKREITIFSKFHKVLFRKTGQIVASHVEHLQRLESSVNSKTLNPHNGMVTVTCSAQFSV